MPPVRFKKDAKTPYNRAAGSGSPSHYTDAQYKALEDVKQRTPRLKLGAARPEFANKVMLADGSISDDLDAVRAATQAGDAADVERLRAFNKQHATAVLEGKLSRQLEAERKELLRWANHSQVDELEAMVAEKRFLFIVDVDLIPRIYFQCAVPGNPDVELAEEETPASTEA
jgi:hypothetical protein